MAKVKNTFYVTTPIYYPNDVPHLGHAYTTIATDALARWHKLLGKEVFFLTGTDEHGKKIEKAADKAGKKPKTFVDNLIPEFKEAWNKLNIKYDRFIRTTDTDHEQVVQVLLTEVHKRGDIYEGYYEGKYCTDCEAYYTEKDLIDNCCPIHKRQVENIKEESYFFKLSKYQNRLLEFYKKNPDFISPKKRSQEIINRVKEGLQDLSISRTSFSWGIPLPFDKNHYCYVWFDALTNYISGIGYLEKNSVFKKFWPADVHIIGKDIVWFHTVIWPAMLMSAGIELPRKVFAHGWWTFNNEKMGKSAGNAVKIDKLIEYAGVDSARYFLLRETPFGEDGDFSESALIERHNNELANKLGNLVSRVSALAEQYGIEKCNLSLDSKETEKKVSEHIEKYELDKALNEIFSFIDKTNEYVQSKKPWETHSKKVLFELSNAVKDIAILLSPFMPETSEKIAKTFNFEISLQSLKSPLNISKIKKAHILFKRIDNMTKKEPVAKVDNPKEIIKSEKRTVRALAPETELKNNTPKVSYEDFSKLEFKVGKILKVEEHPNADKLYILEVDIGNEKRTIVAGLRNHYEKEHLKGKKAIFVTNLAPATLRGVESNGMILAAVNEDEDEVSVLVSKEDIKEGSEVEFKR